MIQNRGDMRKYKIICECRYLQINRKKCAIPEKLKTRKWQELTQEANPLFVTLPYAKRMCGKLPIGPNSMTGSSWLQRGTMSVSCPPIPRTTSPERRLFCSTPPAAASGLANKLRVSRKWHGRWRQARTEMKLGTTNFISKTFFLNSFNKKQPLDVKKAPNAHHKGRVQIKGKKTPTKFPFQKNQAFCFVGYPTWPRSGTGSMGTRTVCGGVDPGFFSR